MPVVQVLSGAVAIGLILDALRARLVLREHGQAGAVALLLDSGRRVLCLFGQINNERTVVPLQARRVWNAGTSELARSPP